MLSSISGIYFAGHMPVSIPSGGVPAIANLIVYYNTADPASFSTSSTTVTNLTLIPNNGTRTVVDFNTVRPTSITNDVITLFSNTAYVSDDVQTTISFWMKADSFSTQIELVNISYSATSYLKVRLRTDGKIAVLVDNPGSFRTFITAAPITLSEWTMVTVSYRTDRDVNAYIAINDTISVNYTVTAWNVIPKNQTTRITANSSAGTSISRYMLWNTKLTAEQISDMYAVQRRYFDLTIPGPDNTIPSPVNMLVYYDMANTSSYSTATPTTVTSLTYYENTASMVGTYTFNNVDPKSMKSLSTDYSNKLYLQNSTTATISNRRPTTIAFWLKTSGTQTESTSDLVNIYINGTGDFFKIVRGSNSFGSNSLFAQYKSGTGTTSVNLNTAQINQSGVWQLILMVIQPDITTAVFKAYINGVLLSSSSIAPNMFEPGTSTQNTSLGMITSSNASWSKYMMWEGALSDAQVTQLYDNQKEYYFGVFSGVLNYTGFNQSGIFLATSTTSTDVTNYGTFGLNNLTNTNVTRTSGTVNVTPPYMTIGATGSITATVQDVYLDSANYVHIVAWVRPSSAVSGNLFTITMDDVTISMSIDSSYVISGTVLKGPFTRNITGQVIPVNKWTMIGISVVLSDTQECFLSIDGVQLIGGGVTAVGSTTSNLNIDIRMTNSSNLRFNQFIITYNSNFTLAQLYQNTKSSYGRL